MFARFLIAGPFVEGQHVRLDGDELHHAARVARVREGEHVELFDGLGSTAEGIVRRASRDRVDIEIIRPIPSRESPLEIVLAAAIISPDRYELVLQKGCELGVARFVPMITARVETRIERVLGKRERWEKILSEAAKQCGRAVLPKLDPPTPLAEVIDRERGLIVFDADHDPDPWPESERDPVTLLIGPEGGLTPDEISLARRNGGIVCSLGPRRLRAETAAIVAVTQAGSRFGDL